MTFMVLLIYEERERVNDSDELYFASNILE